MINDIHGVQPAGAPDPIEPAQPAARAQQASEPQPLTDTLEISPDAQLAAKVHDIPDVRMELVQRVRAEIAAGTYETPERMEIAAARLLDELLPGS